MYYGLSAISFFIIKTFYREIEHISSSPRFYDAVESVIIAYGIDSLDT